MINLKLIESNDSLEELTALLHRAYKRLADMGLRFFATYQTVEDTRERIEDGECFVAYLDNRIVATITLYPTAKADKCEYYNNSGVWYFGQFAVEPELQNKGYGNYCIDFVESYARKNGAKHLALDTSEKALHLVEYYSKRGYCFVQYVQWDSTNYRSVVMSKKL